MIYLSVYFVLDTGLWYGNKLFTGSWTVWQCIKGIWRVPIVNKEHCIVWISLAFFLFDWNIDNFLLYENFLMFILPVLSVLSLWSIFSFSVEEVPSKFSVRICSFDYPKEDKMDNVIFVWFVILHNHKSYLLGIWPGYPWFSFIYGQEKQNHGFIAYIDC